MYDLSILIPARNEMFISNTVEDILKNKRGKTEVIVGLDGEWAEPGIADHPDVRILYVSESIGQRAMTNRLARMSTAKYVAKTDAHCSFDEGFDVKLMDAMKGHDNWTVVPTMRNLHAFDWKCYDCGKKYYQGPTPGTNKGIEKCDDCGGLNFKRKIIWHGKESPQSKSYCFDSEPHFQYFREFNKRPEGQGDITPTMSLQGSFFMLTRDKYWELAICDEGFGSWGSQGIEVAVKTWLSGGEVMVVQTTWYAHMFRTQGGDFSFPYSQQQSKVEVAKSTARELFFENKWPLQKKPLSWLLEKFWPVPGWSEDKLKEMQRVGLPGKEPTKGILYFTDNELPIKLAKKVQYRIRDISEQLLMPLTSSTRKPMDKMGTNVVTDEPRGYLTMFKQILKGLEAMDTDIVFMAEHDVLYPKEHFEFTPPERGIFYYDINWWKVREDGLAIHWDADQVSGLCAYRDDLLEYYRHRVETFDREKFDRKFEPFSGKRSRQWRASVPHIDIRHNHNLTLNKWGIDDFRDKSTAINLVESTTDNIPGWNKSDIMF